VHCNLGVVFGVMALPGVWQRAAGLLGVLLCLLYAGIMLDGSYTYLYKLWRLGVLAEDIPVQRWLLSIILPLGFALLALRLIQQAIDILRGRSAGLLLADEAAETLRDLAPRSPEHRA
jgi:C4-dicarboxylate transporter DctQ subunit